MAQVTNEQLKDGIINRLQTKLQSVGTVKGDIMNAFTQWFQGLVAAGKQLQMNTQAPTGQSAPAEGGE